MKNIFKVDSLLKVFIHLGIIFMLFMGLLLFFFYSYLPKATHHRETITVPKLIGMNADELEKFLNEKNLRFKINDSTFSSDVKANTVLTQHPLPNTKVKESRMIYVTVASKNPPKVAMPNLMDQSIKGAQLTLRQHDLLLGNVISVPGQTDLVYDQMIGNNKVTPGTMVPKGTKINLKVGNSTGVDIDLPDFTGMDIASAKDMAAQYGLTINVIPDPNATEGTIFKQKPIWEEGVKIKVGETVDVWAK